MIKINPDTLAVESVMTFTAGELETLKSLMSLNNPRLYARFNEELAAFYKERSEVMEIGARNRLIEQANP